MQQASAPVKSAGQTDIEREQKKLARHEAAYQKLCTTIERTQRKLDKADKTVSRCVRLLPKLERKRRNMEKAKAERERVAADEALGPDWKPEPVDQDKLKKELSDWNKTVSEQLLGPRGGRLIVNDPTDGYVEPPKPKRSRKKKAEFEIGNQVRLREGKDATIYEIVEFLPDGLGCVIREEGLAPNGKPYAGQAVDRSLLKHAVTDEMLKAFSMGPLKAGRKTKLSV